MDSSFFNSLTVLFGGLDVVDGTRPHNHQESIVLAFDNALGSASAFENTLNSFQCQWNILHEDLRRDERLDTLYTLVVKLVKSYRKPLCVWQTGKQYSGEAIYLQVGANNSWNEASIFDFARLVMGGQIVQGPRLYVCVERPFKSSLWVTPACSWLPDMPYSFHSHSGQFCHHGYGKLEDVVKEAIRKGFKVYGLSEHMPRFEQGELYPEEIEANCSPDILAQIFSDFQEHARYLARKYADQITLLVGTEIEYIHCGYEQHIQALRKSHQIDYIVGSLHHVGGVPIDFSAELYEKALGKHGGHKQLFEAYFDEQFAMLQSIKPEVVGHFDLVRIFAKEENVLPEVWDRIERNVDYVIKYGGIFEINSRAWKKGLQDAYPHKSIIKLIKEKGGRFTLSDDCHGPQDVGLFYDKLAIYLRETGIDVIHYLTRKDGSIVLEQHKHITEDPFWNMVTRW